MNSKQLFLAFIFVVSMNSLFAQDECYQVLRLASRNYTETQTQSILAQKIYNEYTKNYSSSSSSSMCKFLILFYKEYSFGI